MALSWGTRGTTSWHVHCCSTSMVFVTETQQAKSDADQPENAPQSRWERFVQPGDRTALGIWFFWHVATYIYMVLAAPGRTEAPLLDRLTPWDAENFITIAQYGYAGSPGMTDAPKLVAFFPGLPLLLRDLHWLVPNYDLLIVLVSFVGSAVVAVALSRLGNSYKEGAGVWTVLAFFLSPFAVFMWAGYSEAPFLALAIPAWLLARRGRWEWAAVCAAFASSIRISGLFLALGLAVMFLVAENGLRADWKKLPWLVVPGLPVVAYMIFLKVTVGEWMAWNSAQAQYWGRYPEDPGRCWSTRGTAPWRRACSRPPTGGDPRRVRPGGPHPLAAVPAALGRFRLSVAASCRVAGHVVVLHVGRSGIVAVVAALHRHRHRRRPQQVGVHGVCRGGGPGDADQCRKLHHGAWVG